MFTEDSYWKYAFHALAERVEKHFKDEAAREAAEVKAFKEWHEKYGKHILMSGARKI